MLIFHHPRTLPLKNEAGPSSDPDQEKFLYLFLTYVFLFTY